MNSLFFLFASLAVVSGSTWHKFLNRYATIKVLSTCLGEEFMMEWHRNYTKIVDSCFHTDPEEYTRLMYTPPVSIMPQADDVLGIEKPYHDVVPPEQVPQLDFGQVQGPGIVDLNDVLTALQGGSNQPVLLVPIPPAVLQPTAQLRSGYFIRRAKRSSDHMPYFDEERISKIHKSVLLKASNFTCVVQKLKIFSPTFDVNAEILLNQVENLSLDEELKSDIQEGITDCIKFTECKPLKKKTFMPSSVQKAAFFLKCELKQKLSSCVKHELREKQHKFDTEALKKFGNNDPEMDEGDKMFALMYGEMMSNSKKF